MAITEQQIFEIADQLDAEGLSPTLAMVRKRLGGGSFTTISEAMTAWKARKAAKQVPHREPAPQVVLDKLTAVAAEIWAAALEAANTRLAAEREALAQAKNEMEAERAEAVELADTLSAELEAEKARSASLQAAEAAAGRDAEMLREQVASSGERAATAQARAEEIARRADDLNAELTRVNQQNAELVRTLADALKTGKKPVRSAGAA